MVIYLDADVFLAKETSEAILVLAKRLKKEKDAELYLVCDPDEADVLVRKNPGLLDVFDGSAQRIEDIEWVNGYEPLPSAILCQKIPKSRNRSPNKKSSEIMWFQVFTPAHCEAVFDFINQNEVVQ